MENLIEVPFDIIHSFTSTFYADADAHLNLQVMNEWVSEWVSEWVLFNANSAIFQL